MDCDLWRDPETLTVYKHYNDEQKFRDLHEKLQESYMQREKRVLQMSQDAQTDLKAGTYTVVGKIPDDLLLLSDPNGDYYWEKVEEKNLKYSVHEKKKPFPLYLHGFHILSPF